MTITEIVESLTEELMYSGTSTNTRRDISRILALTTELAKHVETLETELRDHIHAYSTHQ